MLPGSPAGGMRGTRSRCRKGGTVAGESGGAQSHEVISRRMVEMKKEERSVGQVRRLLAALGCAATRIEPRRPPRPDVLAEIGGKNVGIETTDYHGGESEKGGSELRKRETQDANANRVNTYSVVLDPIPGLVKSIGRKTQKSYDLSGADDLWLAIFAAVAQPGAVASTFLFPQALDLEKLEAATSSVLQKSRFSRCYLFCELVANNGPVIYCWKKESRWHKVNHGRTNSTQGPTFWDIQKEFQSRRRPTS